MLGYLVTAEKENPGHSEHKKGSLGIMWTPGLMEVFGCMGSSINKWTSQMHSQRDSCKQNSQFKSHVGRGSICVD